uniref:SGF29 C-terminal domain-containing protein n=1 Tax=Spongospora subterranea TaxID=70186 RepID=A0A0H5RN09_9EUKA|eukprot:CRZ10129.1 hypothetical protein [Spongospora subterranea]
MSQATQIGEETANIAEQLHLLKVIREQSQSEFTSAEETIQNALTDALSIPAIEATPAMRAQILSAFGASVEEFRAASSCAAKILSLINSKASSSRPPRLITKIPAKRPYGIPVIRDPEDDIWAHKHSQPFPPQSQVAALIDEHSDPNLWILASVVSFDRKRCRYTVMDNEAEDNVVRPDLIKDYIIECDRLLLLPTLEAIPLQRRVEFLKDECVLAIFPQTTVFYPATVISGPRKVKGHYVLQFADDESNQRRVAAQHVVPLPARYYNQCEKLVI